MTNTEPRRDSRNRIIPAGCKDAKITASNAWRTTYTHIVPGDRVMMETRDNAIRRPQDAADGALVKAAPTSHPKRAMWMLVERVERGNGLVTLIMAKDWGSSTEAAHTAITRQERDEDVAVQRAADKATLGEELAAREAALPTPVVETCVPCGRPVMEAHGMLIGTDGVAECSGDASGHRVTGSLVAPVRVPPTEPQRRTLRMLSWADAPAVNPQTMRVLIRDGWVIIADQCRTLSADAVAWLASEHTAEVTEHVWNGATVYGATCNCGMGQENPRLRRVPWTSGGMATREDAIAVALGHGGVSGQRHKAPEFAVGDLVVVSGDWTEDGVPLPGTVTLVEADGVWVEHAPGCAPLAYGAEKLTTPVIGTAEYGDATDALWAARGLPRRYRCQRTDIGCTGVVAYVHQLMLTVDEDGFGARRGDRFPDEDSVWALCAECLPGAVESSEMRGDDFQVDALVDGDAIPSSSRRFCVAGLADEACEDGHNDADHAYRVADVAPETSSAAVRVTVPPTVADVVEFRSVEETVAVLRQVAGVPFAARRGKRKASKARR